jgi:hypothetical protein
MHRRLEVHHLLRCHTLRILCNFDSVRPRRSVGPPTLRTHTAAHSRRIPHRPTSEQPHLSEGFPALDTAGSRCWSFMLPLSCCPQSLPERFQRGMFVGFVQQSFWSSTMLPFKAQQSSECRQGLGLGNAALSAHSPTNQQPTQPYYMHAQMHPICVTPSSYLESSAPNLHSLCTRALVMPWAAACMKS